MQEKNFVANNYWSATENNSTNAYNVNFNNGNTNNNNKTNANYVRCVRRKWILTTIRGKTACKKMSNEKEAPIYLKLYLLIKELDKMVENFPKHQKYTLGNQTMEMAWDCIDLVIEANNASFYQKKHKISELSDCFDKLKIRLRMSQELGLISTGQFAHIQSQYMSEIGEMIGGWMKWAGEGRK